MARLPVVIGTKDLLAWTRKQLPPYLTRDEVHKVLESVRNNPFHHLLINFLWQTGARISEALMINKKDIDFYAKTVFLPTLKKRKGLGVRSNPLKGDLIGEIGAYVADRNLKLSEKVFPITRQRAFQIVRAACMKAEIEDKRSHPHVFRHSFAVNAVLQNKPLPVIKEWLGHSDINNTMVYLRILSQDTRDFYETLEFYRNATARCRLLKK